MPRQEETAKNDPKSLTKKDLRTTTEFRGRCPVVTKHPELIWIEIANPVRRPRYAKVPRSAPVWRFCHVAARPESLTLMTMSRLVMPPLIASTVLAVLLTTAAAHAESPWYESFEGPEPTWQPDGGDVRFEILVHDRVQGIASTGQGCERLRISGSGGTKVLFRHEVGRPRVVEGLRPSLEVKSDRAGLQFSARVVLPRSVDPRTGQAIRAVLQGTSYTRVGRWEQLKIEQTPEQVARQVRSLRAELRTQVDAREAYVECVLLNVYGGPGITNVWIDDLDLAGFVATGGQWPLAERTDPAATGGPNWLPVGQQTASAAATLGSQRTAGRVVLSGSILLADGHPIFPRIIRHQGESLDLLRQLGFNTVWLREPATAAVLAEAKRLNMWLICPPPFPYDPEGQDGMSPAPKTVGPQYEVVLAWDLGHGLAGRDVLATRGWADQVRMADRVDGRPMVCQPQSDLRTYSRHADVLLVGRPVLGTSLELTDYGRWLRERPRLARPGTPIWSIVQTQPPTALLEQWSALAPGQSLPTAISSEQIRLMVYTAITSGSRGLLFESHSPLDAPDPDTRSRATVLELLNLELSLAEPWLAAGTYVETVAGGGEPEVMAAVLRTDRARLLIPIWSASGAQLVAGQAAGNRVSFIVPFVPEEYRPYLLTAGGMEPLRRSRETGGVRVTLDEFGLTSLVLLTQDPLVVNRLTQQVDGIARRAAQLRRELAVAKLDMVRQVHGQLGDQALSRQAETWLATAGHSLQSCERLFTGRDFPAAYLEAERAMRPLRLLERSDWQTAVGGSVSPVASPATVSFRTLPWNRNLTARLASQPSAPNRLIGGDFENLNAMLQAGWTHVQPPSDFLQAAAELSPEAARSGQLGLRLSARPIDPGAAGVVVETPPAWITTTPVPVEAGQLVVIRGWVEVPQPIRGSVDGLLIIDSMTGEALAERVVETAGWKPFALYRVAPRSGAVTVTFAISGLGEAWVDDVTVQCLGPPGAGTVARDSASRPSRF
jgi:hypothetical protein